MDVFQAKMSGTSAGNMPRKPINHWKETLILLKRLDNLIIGMAQEALEHLIPPRWPGNPTDEVRLGILQSTQLPSDRHGPNGLQIELGIELACTYLAALPSLEDEWTDVNRTILRYFTAEGGLKLGEQVIWLAQVERAGKATWQEAVTASNVLEEKALNGLIERLEIVDGLLNSIQDIHEQPGHQKRQQFSSELEDTVLALIDMDKRGLGIDTTTINRFKAIIRQNRAAGAAGLSTAVDTGNSASGLVFRGNTSGNTAQSQADDAQAVIISASTNLSRPGQESGRLSKYNPTTLVVVVVLTIAATALTVVGWNASPHIYGKNTDADFWFLLQSTLMQLAGMVPIVISLLLDPATSSQPRILNWVFLGSGAVLTILAPMLYCFVPTECSSVLAFAASVMQVFIILEAMVVVSDVSKKKQ